MYVPHINALMYSAVSLKDKKASIFQKLVSQRNSRKVAFFKPFSEERIIQYNLH